MIITQKDLIDSGRNAARIIITERGKDVEYWAGHFGTRFAKEKLALTFSESSSKTGPSRSLKKILETRKTPVHLPFSTNFNNSMGERFYYNGRVIRDGINYHNYNDCSYVAPTEHGKLKVQASQEFAYYGTSCLKVTGALLPQETCKVKLHETEFNIEDGEILVKTQHCVPKGREDFTISVALEDTQGNSYSTTLSQVEDCKSSDFELMWTSTSDKLAIPSDVEISSINLIFQNSSTSVSEIIFHIGELVLSPPSFTPNEMDLEINSKVIKYPITSPLTQTFKIELDWDNEAFSSSR